MGQRCRSLTGTDIGVSIRGIEWIQQYKRFLFYNVSLSLYIVPSFGTLNPNLYVINVCGNKLGTCRVPN